ncbi:MAG: PilZ domain-containing protein [Acidobacteriota bacterium]|nr:PilZ domain-containing protein [Acidobacteriota bacterium]
MATSGAGSAAPHTDVEVQALFLESRRYGRQPLHAALRIGWIGDDRRMEYLAAVGIDVSAGGIGVLAAQRLRLSALVHVEMRDAGEAAVGRVRNCIRADGGWRIGIELTPAK